MGQEHAARILLTGELISSTEAEHIGLVSQVVEGDSTAAADSDTYTPLVQEAIGLAERFATGGPYTVKTTLETLRSRIDSGLEAALQREAEVQAECFATKEFKEGLTAVIEKRKPVF